MADCIVAKHTQRAIQKVDNKWSGQHEAIGTCCVEVESDRFPLMDKRIIQRILWFLWKMMNDVIEM